MALNGNLSTMPLPDVLQWIVWRAGQVRAPRERRRG